MALIAMGAVELAPLPSPGFFTAVSSRCGCPRGLGVQSCPSPISFVFVTVSPFPMVPIQSVLLSVCQGTGWPTSFSGQRFFRCRSILLLVTFCASSSETLFIYSRLSALSFPWLHWSSPGSWLLFPPFSPLYFSA